MGLRSSTQVTVARHGHFTWPTGSNRSDMTWSWVLESTPPHPHPTPPHPITSSPEFEHSHSCLFCTIRYFRKLSKRLGPSSITLPSRSFTDTGQFCFTHLAQADINQPGQHDKTVAPDGFVLMQMNPGPFYHWYLHLRVTHWYTNPFLKGKN